MKKIFFSLLFIIITTFSSRADEGMWLPTLLEQLNQSDMQSMGLKLTAKDIYDINNTSLKDAVCLFGGGCTAEIVSEQGLILTNHHCGYGAIQSHSTLEHDYLADGFWATSMAEELPNQNLSVTFLVRMEDVTTQVLKGVQSTMTKAKRDEMVKANIDKLEKESVTGTHYKSKIKPFYYGNEYYMFITETFNDVRLVGTPPDAIGRFGGDTDNWAWPRHTGDFSVFRIYANKDNAPADYATDNVPYKPKKSLTISLKGVKEGDFTMVYGFPGTTQEYLTSHAINQIGFVENPVKIGIRDIKLEIMGEAMKGSQLVKIQYAAKYAGVANGWKKWSGESKGLRKLNAIEKKKQLEETFNTWANADNSRKEKYGNLIPAFKKVYDSYAPISLAYTYFAESGAGIEIIKYAWSFNTLLTKCNDKNVSDEDIAKLIEQLKTSAAAFFKNYDQPTDKEMFIALLNIYYNNANTAYQPEHFKTIIKDKYQGNIAAYANELYAKSFFVSNEKVQKKLASFKRKKCSTITKDPMFVLASAIYNNYINNIAPTYIKCNDQLDSLYRVYVAGLREMQPEKKFFPDANLTLRLAYGKVAGYYPMDGVKYNYYTTLDGLISKEDSDIDDYQVPAKLKELNKTKDFGRYANADGAMQIAFIATNHTTGGNSGSPVFNGEGQLIGINFDRVWEGTMSDLMFNPDQCRNIALDIRYALFIIEKYAGAKRLIEEMKIIE